ncbi:hypothetical protein LRP88_12993 [Fusarium phalaenopsidis]
MSHNAHQQLEDGGSTVHCNALKWLPLAPKVWIKLVQVSPDTGAYTVIVRAEQGGVLPRHRHLEMAQIYIIKGAGDHPQTGHFNQGDFVTEHKGALHEPLVFNVETELLMISQGPSVFLDENGNDLYAMDVPMLQRLAESAA